MAFANCHTTKISMKVKFKATRNENMDLTFCPRYEVVDISPCYDCEFNEECKAFNRND